MIVGLVRQNESSRGLRRRADDAWRRLRPKRRHTRGEDASNPERSRELVLPFYANAERRWGAAGNSERHFDPGPYLVADGDAFDRGSGVYLYGTPHESILSD